MSLTRRDFMSVFGVSIASLLLARCNWEEQLQPRPTGTPFASCYLPTALSPTETPTPKPLSARERLRLCWLSFTELAQKTAQTYMEGSENVDAPRQDLSESHKLALAELVATGTVSQSVADLIQEAFDAALYHVWRSSAFITCYITSGPIYKPESAEVLIRQVEILDQVSRQGNIDPVTLATARQALEHDLAFYSLSETELQALFTELTSGGRSYPPFEEVEVDIPPEARAAAKFIIDLLTYP